MVKRALEDRQRERIYQLCVEDNISQVKVAQLYGVSQATISNIVREQRYKEFERRLTWEIQADRSCTDPHTSVIISIDKLKKG